MALKDHPVIEKVVAGLIGTAIVSIITTLIPGGWGAVWHFLVNVLNWVGTVIAATWAKVVLGLTFGIPVWGLLCAVAIALVWRAVRRHTEKRLPEPEEKPADQHPDSLIFHKLRWRFAKSGPIPFCPDCDLQILPRHAHVGVFDHGPVNYYCEHCTRVIAQYEKTHDQLVNLLVREVQRQKRVNTKGSANWAQA